MPAPILLRYEGDGEFRVLSNYWKGRADKDFVVGEVYRMVEHHDRSVRSHNHYFASIGNAWANLPEGLADTYPTAEHLRKKALIWTGYRDERTIVAASKAEAQRVAAFVKPMDDFAVVTVHEAVVRVWTAKSQSIKAMGAAEFQKSKSDVLDWLDDLLEVERGQVAGSEAA
jgi:hypothetical protein